MATIRERSGRYHVQIRKAGHPTLTKSFTTRRDGERWARQTEAAIERGETFDAEKHTLAEAIKRYLEDPDRDLNKYQKSVLTWWRDEAKTLDRKTPDGKTVDGKKLGGMDLAKLRRSHFGEAREHLRKLKKHQRNRTDECKDGTCACPTLAPATINRRMSAISAVLTDAMEWDWIATNPARVKRITENNSRTRLLGPDEQVRLLAACKASDEPCLYAFTVCAMSSGARAGELLGLRWSDVDLDRGWLSVTQSLVVRGHYADVELEDPKRGASVRTI
ncbi:MAG: tyrosine-type recombinase/integrase, partial [Pseudomonadales bacterium]